jgi:hypothetical protein
VYRFHEANQRGVGKIALHGDDDCIDSRNFAHARSGRVGNAPVHRAALFDAAARARCPPYGIANMIRILETLFWSS